MRTYLFVTVSFLSFTFFACKKADITTTSNTLATACKVSSATIYDSINKTSATIAMEYDNDGRVTKYSNSQYDSTHKQIINLTESGIYNANTKSLIITAIWTVNAITFTGTKTIYFDDNGNAKVRYDKYKNSTDPDFDYDTTWYTYNSDRYLINEASGTNGNDIDVYGYFNGNRISLTNKSSNQAYGVVSTVSEVQTFEYSDKPNKFTNYDPIEFYYKKGIENKNLGSKMTDVLTISSNIFNSSTSGYVQTYTYNDFNSLGYPTKFTSVQVGTPIGNGYDSKSAITINYICN